MKHMDWSREEVEATVSDYLNKIAHWVLLGKNLWLPGKLFVNALTRLLDYSVPNLRSRRCGLSL
jgi:hypothetical protein